MLTFALSKRPTRLSRLGFLVVATLVLPGCADQEPITPPVSREAGVPSLHNESGAEIEVDERRVIQLPDGRTLEVLHGELATRHLQQLMSRRPEAFANLSLAARGYRPSEEVVVQRITRAQHTASLGTGFTLGKSYTFAQDADEATSEGEITFWSWDDGDDSTWEGWSGSTSMIQASPAPMKCRSTSLPLKNTLSYSWRTRGSRTRPEASRTPYTRPGAVGDPVLHSPRWLASQATTLAPCGPSATTRGVPLRMGVGAGSSGASAPLSKVSQRAPASLLHVG